MKSLPVHILILKYKIYKVSYLDVKSKQKNLKNIKRILTFVFKYGFTDKTECKTVYNDFVKKKTKSINTIQKNLQKMLDIIQLV